jgi:hypothetical protein
MGTGVRAARGAAGDAYDRGGAVRSQRPDRGGAEVPRRAYDDDLHVLHALPAALVCGVSHRYPTSTGFSTVRPARTAGSGYRTGDPIRRRHIHAKVVFNP